MDYLATSPIWLAGGLLVGGVTLLAMAGPFLIRRWVPLRRLRANNEIAGFKFATVGVLYAVLLAFAVLVVWESFNQAESSVAMEAGAAATLYRLADGLGGAEGEALHAATSAYLEAAIGDDWPAMAGGQASPTVTEALNAVYATLLRYELDAMGAARSCWRRRSTSSTSSPRRGSPGSSPPPAPFPTSSGWCCSSGRW